MSFHTAPPKTVSKDTGLRVDDDLPPLCAACLDPFTKSLCDSCFDARAQNARRMGMPEHMVAQLRPRIHRIRREEEQRVRDAGQLHTFMVMDKGSIDEAVMENLKRKQELA